jgi:hypothetical protein
MTLNQDRRCAISSNEFSGNSESYGSAADDLEKKVSQLNNWIVVDVRYVQHVCSQRSKSEKLRNIGLI